MGFEIFGEFGIAGGQDVAPNPLQNQQICINFYPEVDKANTKEITALLGCPGLVQLVAAPGGGAPGFSDTMTTWPVASTVTNLPVRGLWPLPNKVTALAVIGNVCYRVALSTAATATSFPTLTLTPVGTLLTTTGPVSIRDNNSGGYAVIVDGAYGYFYALSGAPTTINFTASVTSGSAVISPTNGLPTAVPMGTPVTDSSGYIPANTTINSMDFNNVTVTLSKIVNGTNASDTITATVPVWTVIADPGFLPADTVAFIDGWWIFNNSGTQKFFTNYPAYGLVFDPTYYALKDAYSDTLIAVVENKEELWLLGDETAEIWYDAGGATFPFQRLVGTPIQYGCRAAHSVSKFYSNGEDCLIWLARNDRGENIIAKTRGFSVEPISPPSFGDEVATYPITDDAMGFTYQEDTHEFYILTFPTADVTWGYDSQSGWMHKRLSYDPYAQAFHRHRAMSFMNFQGMRIVGDYQNGAIYQLTRTAYTDAGWPLVAKRRAPHIWDKGGRTRVFMASLQLDFVPGVGNPAGMGANPQAGISISRDGGQTFGQRWYAPIGQIGQTLTRTMWRRLGFGRDNVIDLEVIDPVKRDLIGSSLRAIGEPVL